MSNEEILNSLEEEVKQAKTNNELNEIRIKYLSKKGTISLLTSKIATLPVEERKEFGSKLNELKNKATLIIEEKKNKIDTEELNKKLESESIDITLPSTKIPVGAPNILEKIVEEIINEKLKLEKNYKKQEENQKINNIKSSIKIQKIYRQLFESNNQKQKETQIMSM